jgi:hypothetical protein
LVQLIEQLVAGHHDGELLVIMADGGALMIRDQLRWVNAAMAKATLGMTHRG